MKTPRRLHAFTLIETLIALAVVMALIAISAAFVKRYADGVANQAAAAHARTVRTAAEAYIKANEAALLSAAGPTSPATIAPAALTAYLPQGFVTTNPFGQAFTVKVIEPSAGRLDALILTTGGDTLSGQTIRAIAQLIGADGGYIETTGPAATAQGAFGGWSRPLAPFGGSPGVGRIAVTLELSGTGADGSLLHRTAIAGRPELNRMNSAVDLDTNDINNAGALSASSVALSSGNSLRIGNAYFYGDGTNTAIRQTGNLYIQTSTGAAAPIKQVGAIQSTGSVSTTGDIAASANVAANNVSGTESYATGWFRTQANGGWYSTAHGGGWYMQDNSWVRAYGGKSVYTPGEIRGGSLRASNLIAASQSISAASTASAGLDVGAGRDITASVDVAANGGVSAATNVSAGGRVSAGEYLLPQGVAVCAASCSTNGLIGRTSAGALLSCDSGRWNGYSCSSGGGGGGGGLNGGCMQCDAPWYPRPGGGCRRPGWPDRYCP